MLTGQVHGDRQSQGLAGHLLHDEASFILGIVSVFSCFFHPPPLPPATIMSETGIMQQPVDPSNSITQDLLGGNSGHVPCVCAVVLFRWKC